MSAICFTSQVITHTYKKNTFNKTTNMRKDAAVVQQKSTFLLYSNNSSKTNFKKNKAYNVLISVLTYIALLIFIRLCQ